MKKNYISPIIDVLDEEKDECFIATSTQVQFSDESSTSEKVKVYGDNDEFNWDNLTVQ